MPTSSEDSPTSLPPVNERPGDTLDSGFGSSFSSAVPTSSEDSPTSLPSVNEISHDSLESSDNDVEHIEVDGDEETIISNEDSEDIVTNVEGQNENLEIPADPIPVSSTYKWDTPITKHSNYGCYIHVLHYNAFK